MAVTGAHGRNAPRPRSNSGAGVMVRRNMVVAAVIIMCGVRTFFCVEEWVFACMICAVSHNTILLVPYAMLSMSDMALLMRCETSAQAVLVVPLKAGESDDAKIRDKCSTLLGCLYAASAFSLHVGGSSCITYRSMSWSHDFWAGENLKKKMQPFVVWLSSFIH